MDAPNQKPMIERTAKLWLKLFIQFMLPGVAIVFVFFYLSVYVVLPEFEATNLNRKREMIRNQVQLADSVIRGFYKKSENGEMEEEEAKRGALETIRKMNFGEQNKDYFWVNDIHGIMLMHPYVKSMENTNVMEVKDIKGKTLFKEFVKKARESGNGFVDYMWQLNDDPTKIAEKISYISLFEPWGWIVGTGVYVEDVRAEIQSLQHRMIRHFLVGIGVVILLSLFTSVQAARLQLRRELAQRNLERLEKWSRSILFHIGEGVIVCDANHWVLFMNATAERMLGLDQQEAVGKLLPDLLPLENFDGNAPLVLPIETFIAGENHSFSAKWTDEGGNYICLSLHLSMLDMDTHKGESRICILSIRDVTERMQIMRELEAHRDRLDKLVEERTAELMQVNEELQLVQIAIDSAADGISILDDESNVIFANQAEEELFEKTKKELIGARHPIFNDENTIILNKEDLLRKKEIWRGEITLESSDDPAVQLDLSITPIQSAGIKRPLYILIEKDITAKRRQEEFLFRLKAAFEQSLDGMIIVNTQMEIEFTNQAWAEMHGYTTEEIIGKKPEFFHSRHQFEVETAPFIEQVRTDGKAVAEVGHIDKNGDSFPTTTSATLIYNRKGEPVAVLVIARDIRRQKANELAVRQSEEKFRSIFDMSKDAIIILEEGNIVDCNRTALEMFETETREEFVSLSVEDLSAPVQPNGQPASVAKMEYIDTAIREGKANFEWTHKKRGGAVFPADVLLSPMHLNDRTLVQGVVRDLTDKHRMEMELRQAQKLESIGQLAAGIAHEINTPIQFVGDSIYYLEDACNDIKSMFLGYHGLLQDISGGKADLDPFEKESELQEEADIEFHFDEVPKAFDRIKRGVDRVTTIVRAMKEFAHPDSSEMELSDLNQLVETTVTVATNEYKYVATVNYDLGDIPLVPCHRGEINQVLINLIVNAAHAIEGNLEDAADTGVITIRTRDRGEFVEIAVSDTGSGIPEEIRNRIFDPFFTTKKVGVGSGQGLAISRSLIVDKHKGNLTFETEPGKGTTFTIQLPIEVRE